MAPPLLALTLTSLIGLGVLLYFPNPPPKQAVPPAPPCPPGVKGCLPPSPTTYNFQADYPILISDSRTSRWKLAWDFLVGNPITVEISHATSGAQPGTYNGQTIDEWGHTISAAGIPMGVNDTCTFCSGTIKNGVWTSAASTVPGSNNTVGGTACQVKLTQVGNTTLFTASFDPACFTVNTGTGPISLQSGNVFLQMFGANVPANMAMQGSIITFDSPGSDPGSFSCVMQSQGPGDGQFSCQVADGGSYSFTGGTGWGISSTKNRTSITNALCVGINCPVTPPPHTLNDITAEGGIYDNTTNRVLTTPSCSGGITCTKIGSTFTAALTAGIPSVVDYGAKCDGTTNDLSAFNAALAATTGPLYVPPGLCLIAMTSFGLALATGNVLYGGGAGITTLLFRQLVDSGTPAGLFIGSNVNNITVHDLTLKYDASLAPSTVAFLISLAGNTTNVHVYNTELDGSMTDNGVSKSVSIMGLSLSSSSNTLQQRITLENCEFHHLAYGVLKTNAALSTQIGFLVVDSVFHDNYGPDLLLNTPSGAAQDVFFSGNRFWGNRAYLLGILVQAIGTAGPALNVQIVDNIITGTYLFNAIHLEEGPQNFVVSGNIIYTQGWGITLQWNNVNINNANGTSPVHGVIEANTVELSSGTIVDTQAYGISVVYNGNFVSGYASAIEVIISGNVVSGQYGVGIEVAAAPWHAVSVLNNQVDGAISCYWFVSGSLSVDNNLSANCSLALNISTNAMIVSHRFLNNAIPFRALSAPVNFVLERPVFMFNPLSITGGVTTSVNLLPVNGSAFFTLRGNVMVYDPAASSDFTSIQYDQLRYDGTAFNIGPSLTNTGSALAGFLAFSSPWLTLGVFCAANRANVTAEVFLEGTYTFTGQSLPSTGGAGAFVQPAYNGVGTSTFTLGGSTVVGTGATAVCRTSYNCDSVSGSIRLTMGTGVSATGTFLTINFITTRAFIPTCIVGVDTVGDASITPTPSITNLALATSVQLSSSPAVYFVRYHCLGG